MGFEPSPLRIDEIKSCPGRVQRPGPEACFRPVFGAPKVFQGEMSLEMSLERSGKIWFLDLLIAAIVGFPRFCAKNSDEGNELEIARKKSHISDHFQTARKEFCRKTRQAYCCILVA